MILTRRLLLAKQLLTETQLPVTDIAFASGFSSLRRFNHAFCTRYTMPPTRLRKKAAKAQPSSRAGPSTLYLSYRPPYDWPGILAFLGRANSKASSGSRSTFMPARCSCECQGWIRLTQSEEKHSLALQFTHSLAPVLPALLNRLRDLFDLDARPELISEHLAKDKVLGPLVDANPGLRVPGAFNGFELGLRAILGQQVTVKAATTLAGRLVAAVGEPIATPFADSTA